MLKTLIISTLLVISSSLPAQVKDSLSINTPNQTSSVVIIPKQPKPGRAALYSAILPGAGQFYNKSYIKMPFIYAGIGALIYTINQQHTRFKCFEYAHRLSLLDIKPNTLECRGLTLDLTSFNAQGLKTRRDGHRKNMELAYIGLSLFYIANIVDAYVDAHLNTFDINEDLSFQLAPYIKPDLYQSSVGLTLTFRNR